MDASGVALVIIGPGSVDQVCPGSVKLNELGLGFAWRMFCIM